MAGSVAEVEERLRELVGRLEPLARADTEKLRLLKLKDAAEDKSGEVEDASRLYIWDRSYYLNKQMKESFSVDTAELARYFEATHTFDRMLSVFERLFSMQFQPTHANTWHGDVKVYVARNSASEGAGFLGYLYADLFERPGKYRGAHHRMMKAVSLCLNPCSLLSRFAALGIHNLVATTKYAIPHSRDFIEIPSIMLENWIWIPEVLVSLSQHHAFTKKAGVSVTMSSNSEGEKTVGPAEEILPLDLARAVCLTRSSDMAHTILAQVQPALFDMAIHAPADHQVLCSAYTTELWIKSRRDVLPYVHYGSSQDSGFGQGGFPHIFRKNDAGYFTYPL